MGGWSSGRCRTRNRGAVEASLRLDIRSLRRAGYLRPGARASGIWSWSCRGQPSGSIRFAIDLSEMSEPMRGSAELSFSVNGEPRAQTVEVDGVPCRYGGWRYYFVCPRTGDRCEVLCGVGGYFASREHHRLTYHSQSEDALGRVYRSRDKAKARAFGEDFKPRPRGANRKRLVKRWIDCERAADELFAFEAVRRFGARFAAHGMNL